MIKVKNVTYDVQFESDSSQRILDGINLEITQGQAITIMGPNGSGKTTLVRCLNGLLLPTTGEIEVDNLATHNPQNNLEIKKRVGMIFQNPENQIVSTSVEREIAFGLENLGVPRKQMHEIVDRILKQFRLTSYRKYPPHLLSGGEKQRLAIAAVMAMNPKYLILDEPTSFLDSIGKNEILSLLKQLHRENQNRCPADRITTILITQFPEEALRRERLLIMVEGRIIEEGHPDEIFRKVDFMKHIGLDVPIEYELAPIIQEKYGLDAVAIMEEAD